jgi:carboxyl-terminal processing protease
MPLRNLSIIVLAAIVSLACYLRASRNRYVDTITEAMNIISDEYVDEVDQRKLFEGAMDGMVSQLDEYSGYHPPEEYEQFREDIDQQIVGIGVFVEFNAEQKKLVVVAPLVGTPAYEAGVKPGDVIVSIDGVSTADLTLNQATNKIKGRAGTAVQLELLHVGEQTPVKLAIKRASIAIDSVLGDLRGPDGKWTFRLAESQRIGYIRVSSFGERTAGELRSALAGFRASGQEVEGLILDLRGNEGGLLDAAVEVCDMFLNEGLIVRTVGRNNANRDESTATRGVEFSPELPLVVMVDRFSASASEIVAACLQDHQRAVVIGQRSWGKGTVQNVIRMEGGRSAIRLTIARYLRPSGKNIHKHRDAKDGDDWGVRPDPGQEINLTQEEYERFRRGRNQRDSLSSSGKLVWPGATAKSAEASSSPGPPMPPSPQPESGSAAAPPPTGESALDDDAQLRRAVDELLKKIQGTPRRA